MPPHGAITCGVSTRVAASHHLNSGRRYRTRRDMEDAAARNVGVLTFTQDSHRTLRWTRFTSGTVSVYNTRGRIALASTRLPSSLRSYIRRRVRTSRYRLTRAYRYAGVNRVERSDVTVYRHAARIRDSCAPVVYKAGDRVYLLPTRHLRYAWLCTQ